MANTLAYFWKEVEHQSVAQFTATIVMNCDTLKVVHKHELWFN
jgi:hypothetical protein